MRPIVKTSNLSVAYNLGKSNEFWALRDINLEIYPGEYVVFWGPSGCGKSTLLYTISGLESPTTGEVIVDNKNLKSLSKEQLIEFHRSTIGMIFQAYYLLPSLSVKDNILLPQFFSNQPIEKRNKRAEDLMKKFGIYQLRDRRISQLSGGQQQRVAIARALINNPLIILADEAVGNLDSKNAKIVLDLLKMINKKEKKTIIYVTHNPQYISQADKIFYMKDGKITRESTNIEKLETSNIPKEKLSEIQRLAQAYPYLSQSRLEAKLIFYHLLLPFGAEDQEKIERIIDKYILGKINQKELFDELNNPPEKGGANLYVQKAKELSQKIVELVKEIKITKEEKIPTLTLAQQRAIELRTHLLDNYEGNPLSIEQIKRLDELLGQRITNKIGRKELERLLNLSFSHNGVGLNRRTAKRFVREIEIILME